MSQLMMQEKWSLSNVDQEAGCVYYREDNSGNRRVLCYQSNLEFSFELYECHDDGSPSVALDFNDYVQRTPLPEGNSETEIALRKWLVSQVTFDINNKVNAYLKQYDGTTSDTDLSVNEYSREMIRRIDEVYGQCYLINVNLMPGQKGDPNAVSMLYEKGERWNGYNFCADLASPLITDELSQLVLEWNASDDAKDLERVCRHLDTIGAQWLIWS